MPANSASTHVSFGPRRGRKYFTLEEANRAIVYVTKVVDDITDCYCHAVDVRERIERPLPSDNAEELKLEYEHDMDRLNDLIDELHQVGVELKDFEKGLLDFPALHQNREIYYCWHRGESQIQSWHEADAGYSARHDVRELQDLEDAA